MFNSNSEIIKYLMGKFNYQDTDLHSAFLYACYYNQDINIIKFIKEEFKINVNYTDHIGDNFLLSACHFSENSNNKKSNIDIIKYFIEELKVDIYIQNNNGDNCLT